MQACASLRRLQRRLDAEVLVLCYLTQNAVILLLFKISILLHGKAEFVFTLGFSVT